MQTLNTKCLDGGLCTRSDFHEHSEPDRPRVTVITVVRNGRDVIEQTIQSVLNQRYPNLEYIVIDGGSTDGTVDVIKKYTDRIIYWVTESDNGIYDAMNKALDNVHGEGHLFLNAGDHFVGDVIYDVPSIPSHIKVFRTDFLGRLSRANPKNYRQGLPYCHQGIVFQSKGVRFDTSYHFAADYLYYLDHGYTRLPASDVTGHVYYDNAGLSKINSRTRDREIAGIIKDRFGIFWYALFVVKCTVKDSIRSVFRR